MSVNVSLGFFGEPSPHGSPNIIAGGIKIIVGGNRLTRYRDYVVDEIEYHKGTFDKEPEYIGGAYLRGDVMQISRKTIGLLTGSYEGSDTGESEDASEHPDMKEHRIRLDGLRVFLVLSGLDGKHIRVAFQDDRQQEPLTYLRDKLGYAVDGNDFGEEILGCIQQFFSYARKCDIDESEMPDLKKNRDRLEEIVE